MSKIKNILKAITPPIIISAARKLKTPVNTNELWAGSFSSWDQASANCTGYDSQLILEKCKNSLLKVKNKQAIYERDSVIFDEIQYSWGLLAGLLRAAVENDGKLCVLDFGGSLGSTFYQNKSFLSSLKEYQWCIVEQSHFVDCGKSLFEDSQLNFYYTIEECLEKRKPNVLLLSSVLQYLQNPYTWIEKFIGLDIPYIIIDRTSFTDSKKDLLTVQNVPKSIYTASYPTWFFNFQNFLQCFNNSYELILSFDDNLIGEIHIMEEKGYWKGLILKKNSNY